MEYARFTVTKTVALPELSADDEVAVEALRPVLVAAMSRRVDALTTAFLQPPPQWEPEPITYRPGAPLWGPSHWIARDWRSRGRDGGFIT